MKAKISSVSEGEDSSRFLLIRNLKTEFVHFFAVCLVVVLKAESAADQSKFGKVRLSNPKINESIASVPHALEVLEVRCESEQLADPCALEI